jgi:type I restriction enzyme S subunit
MVKLGEVCLINPKSCTLRDDTEVSFIPMTKVGEHGEFDASEIKNYSEVKKGFTNFQNGDILFAKITPCMENGKGAIAHNMKNGIGFGSTEFHVLRPDTDKITSEWLYYLTTWKTFRKEAERNMTGSAGQKRVPKTFLENYVVNLPDIDTQKSENKILRKVDDLIFLRKQQLAKLDELVKARFVEMFGDPVVNSKRWPVETIENHIDLLTGFPFDSSGYVSKGVNICGGLIIMPQKIDWSACKHWPQITGYEDYILRPNDIVIALDRPWISNGFKIAMVDREHLPALLIQRTARIRAVDINQHYLMQSLLLGRFDKHCNITGSLVPHISPKDIKSYSVMLPPIELQNQFATFVERVDQQKQTVQQSLEKLELMKKALMQEYFG